jgi:hypothetical protein
LRNFEKNAVKPRHTDTFELNAPTLHHPRTSASPAPRHCLGVRTPRVPSQGHLAPSQQPAHRDALCPVSSHTCRALSTGPPWVPLRARRSRPLALLRVKAGVSRRGEGTFSLPTYKTGRNRPSARTPRAAIPAVRSPTVWSTPRQPMLRHTFPRLPKS